MEEERKYIGGQKDLLDKKKSAVRKYRDLFVDPSSFFTPISLILLSEVGRELDLNTILGLVLTCLYYQGRPVSLSTKNCVGFLSQNCTIWL